MATQLQKETQNLTIHLESIQKLMSKDNVYQCQSKRYEQCQNDLATMDAQIRAYEATLEHLRSCPP